MEFLFDVFQLRGNGVSTAHTQITKPKGSGIQDVGKKFYSMVIYIYNCELGSYTSMLC